MSSGLRLTQHDVDEAWRVLKECGGNKVNAARAMGMSRSQFYKRLEAEPEAEPESQFATEYAPPIGAAEGTKWEIKSNSDNTFRFAAFGDLHAASKYARWDVRADLTRLADEFGAQAILDTGNWIDGERDFNRYDLEAVGLDAQVKLLAKNYPKTKIPTYAITGADHEGWYVKTEGIDVGRYCENVMRESGHAWTNLGYIESDIILRNANSGEAAVMRLIHPGGGSAYALSYRPQKIIESLEGGEKPDVLLIGHYHKLEAGQIRNVWYAQTACQQDQTPFLRTRSIEAHIGGLLIEMQQDPKDGNIIGFKPDMRRYFNRAYYFKSGYANERWSGHGPIKQIPRAANLPA